MFYKLICQNSKRNHKQNGLFFASLVVSIVAFYIILSLSQQDVMRFLQQMESDAVNRLLSIIPAFYGMTLILLFFLIYFACKFQLEYRRHELGLYLMLGMRRRKLFFLLFAEDFRINLLSLLVGLPTAVLLSELTSLITAKLVGLGIIGHQFSLSWSAILWTVLGFLAIKVSAFIILSGKISCQEIHSLLVKTPEGTKKQLPTPLYALALFTGVLLLGFAYSMAIQNIAWQTLRNMTQTLICGLAGTFLLFFGMRFLMRIAIEITNGKLHIFNFRQLEENIIYQSNVLAISSLLILSALCCFGAGMSQVYRQSDTLHVLDYTFKASEDGQAGAEHITRVLKAHQLDGIFSSLFPMKVGHIPIAERTKDTFMMQSIMKALRDYPVSDAQKRLYKTLSDVDSPYLISLSGYNALLTQAGLPTLHLMENEAAIYMDDEFLTPDSAQIFNTILSEKPEAQLNGFPLSLTGTVQTTNLVTDRAITLGFALILPDEIFSYQTHGVYSIYVNAILSDAVTHETGLMHTMLELNQKLDSTGLSYESYLQNRGRQLFYIVASSYITIYLATIFLIIANTVIGVQFLMRQQKTTRRYQILIRLGAVYEDLCKSANQQIYWHFGIPIVVAVLSSLFGIKGLLTGLLDVPLNTTMWFSISVAMILLLCVIEYIYIKVVTRASSHYLFTLMSPQREE